MSPAHTDCLDPQKALESCGFGQFSANTENRAQVTISSVMLIRRKQTSVAHRWVEPKVSLLYVVTIEWLRFFADCCHARRLAGLSYRPPLPITA